MDVIQHPNVIMGDVIGAEHQNVEVSVIGGRPIYGDTMG